MAWLTGNIVTNGIKIHYHRTGGDKPALVIAHGITDNGNTWSRIARELEDSYDVIMYDQRGTASPMHQRMAIRLRIIPTTCLIYSLHSNLNILIYLGTLGVQ